MNSMELIFRLNKRLYTWCGWYGCQLESYEWLRVPAGTIRNFKFADEEYNVTVASTRRDGLKIRTTWLLSHRGTMTEYNEYISKFSKALRSI